MGLPVHLLFRFNDEESFQSFKKKNGFLSKKEKKEEVFYPSKKRRKFSQKEKG